jgi:hypothetical protein
MLVTTSLAYQIETATIFLFDRIVLESIADNLSKAGWSWGCVTAIDDEGRTLWIVDAHRDDGKRFVVRADEKLTVFLELESACRQGETLSMKIIEVKPVRCGWKVLPGVVDSGHESTLRRLRRRVSSQCFQATAAQDSGD